MAKIPSDSIAGVECRHVVHIPADHEQGVEDVHMVKEQVHLKDGSVVPNLRFIKNFKRTFHVTQKAFRNHKQKKDYESLDKLTPVTCIESDLTRRASKALGLDYMRNIDLRKLKESPYLYGVDVDSRNLVAAKYKEIFAKTKLASNRRTVAGLDIETDMVNRDSDSSMDEIGDIIMASITFKNKAYVTIAKSFFKDIPTPREKVEKAIDKYLSKFIEERQIKVEIEFANNEYEIVRNVLKKAHEWKPDFISIWNMEFEMNAFISAAKRHDFNLTDLFSDPSIPSKYRKFYWKPGKAQRITASGKFTPVKPHNRWPVLEATASFKFVDSMCAYRHIRLGAPEESSYALDAILAKEKIPEKLRIPEAERFSGADWHFVMQTKHKPEYVAYNIYDCIALELLDEKTKDLSSKLPIFLDCSDVSLFGSQPSRTAEAFHHFCLENNHAIACTSPEMESDLDKVTLPLSGWIIALSAHTVADNGLKCLEELPMISTNLRAHIADLDISSSYPYGQSALNISKSTTQKEIIGIKGFDTYTMRMQGLNLSGGQTNAIEFCTTMLSAPTPLQLLQAFIEEQGIANLTIPHQLRRERPMASLRSEEEEDEDKDPMIKVEKIKAKEDGVEYIAPGEDENDY